VNSTDAVVVKAIDAGSQTAVEHLEWVT
jgi:hypothetical protein